MNEPFAFVCPVNCGCMWRDNKDDTMSLFGPRSQSCKVCEYLPLAELLPVYLAPNLFTPEGIEALNKREAEMDAGQFDEVAPEPLCATCGHSYAQHSKGIDYPQKYCRHCPCLKWAERPAPQPKPGGSHE